MPVRVLSRFFRRLFLTYLRKAFDAGELHFFSALEPCRQRRAFLRYLAPTWNTKWVVYAKAPFSGPEEVLEYAARYTHRVAISNDRLLDIQDEKVQFRWRDYRDDNHNKIMTVTAEEFIRRFLLHVLPEGFHRVRHYGFLANCYRKQKLARCRELLKMPPPQPKSQEKTDYRGQYEELTGISLKTCPICHHGHMAIIERFDAGTMPPIIDTP